MPRQIKLEDPSSTFTVIDNVAEVLGADTGPDGGPGVGLGPAQLTAGGGIDRVAGVAQLDGGGETFPATVIDHLIAHYSYYKVCLRIAREFL